MLDVGVGTGLSLSDYSRTTRLCGVDISEPMLRKAHERVRALNLTNVDTLAVMDAKNLAFPDSLLRRGGGAICHHRGARSGSHAGRFHPRAEARRRTDPGQSHRRRERPAPLFELAFAPLARRLGWRPEFPWARLVNWAARHGGVTLTERRPMPPMGHFSLDPLPQVLTHAAERSAAGTRAAGRFPADAHEAAFCLDACCWRPPSAAFAQAPPGRPRHRPDRAAAPARGRPIARRCSRMPQSGAAAFPTAHHRPGPEPLGDRLARSDGVLCPPAGIDPEIRAPDPGSRQYAGDSAARQPRWRPDGPAEIAPICRPWPAAGFA